MASGLMAGAAAAEPAADKSSFTLFHPTPIRLLRDLSTDRPDQTESPYTVDAGHVQVELDFVNHIRDHDTHAGADVRSRTWTIAPVNLKFGLLPNADLQLMFDPCVRTKVEDRVARTAGRTSGTGDLATRLKVNLWGNDGGPTALALMPYVKWPLSASDVRNGKTEGGLIVPLGIELAPGWSLGLMTELDWVRNATNTGTDREWLNSITLGRELTEKVGCYAEFVAVTGSAPGYRWQGQVDFGVTYAVNANLQLDAGCNFGVTKSAPDYQPFAGVSYRY